MWYPLRQVAACLQSETQTYSLRFTDTTILPYLINFNKLDERAERALSSYFGIKKCRLGVLNVCVCVCDLNRANNRLDRF